jgi:hypothetical protein
MFLVLVALIVYASRFNWQTEAFVDEYCPRLSNIEQQVLLKKNRKLLTEDEFIAEGIRQIYDVLGGEISNYRDCTLSAHYEDQNEIVSKVITNQTSDAELTDFLRNAFQKNSNVNFNACLSGNRFMGTKSGGICKPDSTSNIISGGSQGCNEHNNNNNACLDDDNCVLYRRSGGTGNSFCYPKCSTIEDADDCNNNSRSFCEYKNGKCGYKCSNFNAKSTLDNHLHACRMNHGCKVHNSKCVDKGGTHTLNTYQQENEHSAQSTSSLDNQSGIENKPDFTNLTIKDDQNPEVYNIFNKENQSVGQLPKCKIQSNENTSGQMVENGEGTFLCKGMNACLDTKMLNFVGGVSSELDAEQLVETINQRCGNNI